MDNLGKDIRTVAIDVAGVGDSAEVYAVETGKVKANVQKAKKFVVVVK